LNRASVLLRAGDYAGAAAEYRKVLEQNDANDAARVGLAIALRGQEKHKEAAAEYERVLAHSPNHPAALFDLGILRAEFLDRRGDARELFERFLAVAPEGAARDTAERYVKDLAADAARGDAEQEARAGGAAP
jgi:tetratricopeptide (TPR) repeat protein